MSTDQVNNLRQCALWYAWGRKDADPSHEDSDPSHDWDPFDFADYYKGLAEAYRLEQVTYRPSITDAFKEWLERWHTDRAISA
jgi:hypothetical protein